MKRLFLPMLLSCIAHFAHGQEAFKSIKRYRFSSPTDSQLVEIESYAKIYNQAVCVDRIHFIYLADTSIRIQEKGEIVKGKDGISVVTSLIGDSSRVVASAIYQYRPGWIVVRTLDANYQEVSKKWLKVNSKLEVLGDSTSSTVRTITKLKSKNGKVEIFEATYAPSTGTLVQLIDRTEIPGRDSVVEVITTPTGTKETKVYYYTNSSRKQLKKVVTRAERAILEERYEYIGKRVRIRYYENGTLTAMDEVGV